MTTDRTLFLLIAVISITVTACNPYKTVIRKHDLISQSTSQSTNITNSLSTCIVEQLKISYPFTGHKAIQWDAFEAGLQEHLNCPQLSDTAYLKIRELFFSLPDASLNISRAGDKQLMKAETAGYCGFEIAKDDAGNYFVCSIDSSSDAWIKGLRQGDKILGWNGSSIHQVVQNTALRWGYHPAGINFREILQQHYLSRGPAGSSTELFYESATGNTRGIRVNFESEPLEYAPAYIGIPAGGSKKEFTVTNSKLGIWTIPAFTPAVLQQFRKHILPELSSMEGLIIDLRENSGGNDAIAASLTEYFISDKRLYESTLIRDLDTDIWTDLGDIHAHPVENAFTKPVIILIGPLCTGAGEGFARIMQMEDHIRTLGIWNTKGSFSYPGGVIKIQGKFTIHYPIGMSLDENRIILIESPGDYGGGIYPDIRIPARKEILMSLSSGYDILIDEAIAHIGR